MNKLSDYTKNNVAFRGERGIISLLDDFLFLGRALAVVLAACLFLNSPFLNYLPANILTGLTVFCVISVFAGVLGSSLSVFWQIIWAVFWLIVGFFLASTIFSHKSLSNNKVFDYLSNTFNKNSKIRIERNYQEVISTAKPKLQFVKSNFDSLRKLNVDKPEDFQALNYVYKYLDFNLNEFYYAAQKALDPREYTSTLYNLEADLKDRIYKQTSNYEEELYFGRR
jgi:hypothetical protein